MKRLKTKPKMLQQNTTKIFSNFAIVLPAMRIMDEVQLKISVDNTIIAFVIKLALKNGRPYKEIISTIKDMATDNKNAIADIIGLKLTNEILKF